MAEPKASISKQEINQSLVDVYNGVKDHFNGHRTSTELYFLELIRKVHPEYFVVCTTRVRDDLRGFAAAGHANIRRNDEDDIGDMTRSYRGPSARIDPNPGSLVNKERFAHLRYEWNNHEFLVYTVEYVEPNLRLFNWTSFCHLATLALQKRVIIRRLTNCSWQLVRGVTTFTMRYTSLIIPCGEKTRKFGRPSKGHHGMKLFLSLP